MNPFDIIDKYYPEDNQLKRILLTHSRSVAQKALSIIKQHPNLIVDEKFLFEAAILHDIGIFLTDAPGILCYGDQPYICHGYLGAELLRKEGYPKHAKVCEHHTGAGISMAQVKEQNLPIPENDYLPTTLEEEIICFADKFFSKTKLDNEKSIEKAQKSIARYGEEGLIRFNKWCKRFL